jgi:hypothetical protein
MWSKKSWFEESVGWTLVPRETEKTEGYAWTKVHPTICAAMYERFTDRARKVMQLANQEANRFNHECIPN